MFDPYHFISNGIVSQDVVKSSRYLICSYIKSPPKDVNCLSRRVRHLISVSLFVISVEIDILLNLHDIFFNLCTDPVLDTSKPNMTEAQVLQCGEDLKTFYREQMCKIKPDPLDFNIIWEFQQIYTNLTLLKNRNGNKENQNATGLH